MPTNTPRKKPSDLATEEIAMIPGSMRRGSWRIAGDLTASFRYAAQGLGYAFATQRNFRIHLVVGLVVFSLATWLQLDLVRLAVLVLTVAAVLVLESPIRGLVGQLMALEPWALAHCVRALLVAR